jgi:HK97 family phage portal protein
MSMLSRAWDFLTFRDLPASRPIQTRAAATTFPAYVVNKPQWLPTDPATLAVEGYDKVVVAFACANVIAEAVASAPMRAMQNLGTGDMEPIAPSIASSPGRLAMLVKTPNPYESQPEFLESVVKIAAVTGLCVYEKVRGPAGQVVALYPLRTDWLYPIPRNNQAYDWEYRVPGVRPPFFLKAEDVGTFRYNSSPMMGPMGTPPLYAAMRAVAIENTMADFVKVFFQNNGVPSWVAVLKDEYQSIDQDDAEAAAERLMQRFGQGRGAGRIAIMPGLERIERVQANFDEMAFTDLSDMTAASICSAFAVPPILIHTKLGLDASTYSNYGQARRAFYEDTITPLWRRLDGAMTRALLPEFDVDESVSLEFDTSEIPALQDDLTNERAQKIELWRSQVITRNEIRSDFGYSEIEDESGAELHAPASPFGMLPMGDEDEERTWGGLRVVEAQVSGRPQQSDAEIKAAWTRALSSGEPLVRLQRLPPETRAAVVTTARDAYDALTRQGAPELRRFWTEQGERVVAASQRSVDRGIALCLAAYPDEPMTRDELLRYLRDGMMNAKEESWPEYVEVRDIAALDWDEEEALLLAALVAIHERALRRGWRSTAAMGLPEAAFALDNPYVDAALTNLGRGAARITATTQEQVRQTVAQRLDEGATMDELATSLRNLFGATYKSRADLIAHHESMLAYTDGVVAAAKSSGTVSYAELYDNPQHYDDYGASDGLTCAQRHDIIVPLDRVPFHADGEHPNGSFTVGLVFDAEE